MKIRNLCKTYDIKNGEKVHALKNVSFDLPSTGMVAILGKSGSGKSKLSKPLRMFKSVDLPLPDLPSRNTMPVSGRVRSTLLRAVTGTPLLGL